MCRKHASCSHLFALSTYTHTEKQTFYILGEWGVIPNQVSCFVGVPQKDSFGVEDGFALLVLLVVLLILPASTKKCSYSSTVNLYNKNRYTMVNIVQLDAQKVCSLMQEPWYNLEYATFLAQKQTSSLALGKQMKYFSDRNKTYLSLLLLLLRLRLWTQGID